jgi:colanic acid/amylovoran biosynthesis glycosyltransferase
MAPSSANERIPVLHAVHTVGVPSETFIRDAIAETEALGWTSWLITEGTVVERGSVALERIVTTPSTLPLLDRIVVRVPVLRRGDPNWARAARKYLAAFAQAPPGIAHAHFGWTGAHCSLVARKLGLPLIVSFHGTDLTVSPVDSVWREPYAKMLSEARAVTVVSRFLEGKLRGVGYEGTVEIIPSGVRLESFPFSGGPRPGETPRILFVGRLIACKGVDTLIEALARTRSEGVEATLRIVGDGPLRGELEETVRATGMERAVHFAGTFSHAEVREELQRSDIVVVPSRPMPDGQAEGSSVVSKEAQAIGVPVVATDVGGIPETLPPEIRSELVPPDQPGSLAARIMQVWSEREEWPERARRQREWVESEFAWARIAPRLSAIYDRMIQEYSPPRARLARRLHSGGSVRRGNLRARLR